MCCKKNDFWTHFKACATDSFFKMSRAKCKYCKANISSAQKNMCTHHRNCPSFLRSIGQLLSKNRPGSLYLQSYISKSSKQTTATTSTSHTSVQTLGVEMKKELDIKFSRAMHGTATSFKFDHPLWIDFFS